MDPHDHREVAGEDGVGVELPWLELRGVGPQLWPVVLDLAEWSRRTSAGAAIDALAEVIAPRHDQIEWSKQSLAIASDDIGADLDSDRMESFLRAQLVRLIAGGARVRGRPDLLPRLRRTDAYVLRRIQWVQAAHGAHGAHDGGDAAREPAATEDPTPVGTVYWSTADNVTRYVSASAHGVPAACLGRLNLRDPRDSALLECITGPDGQPWWRVAPHVRVVSSARDRARLAAVRRVLFEAWPVEGWGYIRRLGLLVLSRPSAGDLVAHYPEALYGYSALWRTEDLWRYLAAIVRRGLRDACACTHEVNWIATAVALGRIAPDKKHELATIRLIELAERRWAHGHLSRARVRYELGNMHARLRVPRHLASARRCLDAASAELDALGAAPRVEQMRAQIANTRALVAYHANRNEEALELELLADTIARASSEAGMREWADVTLALNRARLIEKRFGDTEGALELLRGLIGHSDRNVSARASLSVARLLMQRNEWREVIAVIDAALSGESSSMMLEEEEVLLLLMQAAALAASGERARTLETCQRIEFRNRLLGSATVAAVVRDLEQLLAREQAGAVEALAMTRPERAAHAG